jgi:hypothetical protein
MFLVAEELLNFPQILSYVLEEDRRRAVPQPTNGDLLTPTPASRLQPRATIHERVQSSFLSVTPTAGSECCQEAIGR